MNIIFDFDGVILNSHKVKTKAFYEVFKSYGNSIGVKARKFHENNIGKSRYFKFKYIFKNILNKKITKNELARIDKNFNFTVEKKIRYMFPTENLLKFLKNKKKYHNFYISTGTPQKKIVNILKEKKLFFFFKKIYGSPRSKLQHLNEIKKKNIQSLFIGDSYEDYKVSKQANINFLLKMNSENLSLRKKKNIKKINSFKYLEGHIKFLNLKYKI